MACLKYCAAITKNEISLKFYTRPKNEINPYVLLWKDVQDKLNNCVYTKQLIVLCFGFFLNGSYWLLLFFSSSYQTYIPPFWYSHDQIPKLVILLGLTRLDNKLYSWLKFVTIKSTEQKQQEEDMHQGVQGGLVQVSSRAAQDVLSLWQQMTGTCAVFFCLGKHIWVSGSEAFVWEWFCKHILLATSHDTNSGP